MRLLLIEDDASLGSVLKRALEKHSYGVDWLQDGESGLAAIEDLNYSVVILDLNLPKLSGLEVVRSARQKNITVPILLLSALGTPIQKVQGLDVGADDYLVKPFDLDELVARLRALSRRRDGRTQVVLRSGSVEIDPAAMVVRNASAQVPMTAKEFQMLMLLVERAGKYVTKSDIEYALYSAESAVESNTTEVMIYNLRKKLSRSAVSDTSLASNPVTPASKPDVERPAQHYPDGILIGRSNVGNDGAVRSIANEPVVFVVDQESRSRIDLVCRTHDETNRFEACVT